MIEEARGSKKKYKKNKKKYRDDSLIFDEEEEKCSFENYSCESYNSEAEEELEVEEGKEGGKLIRAASIVNMKITEKIMVLSDASDCSENEDWEKTKK